jgi:hypothetical protein
MTKRPNIEACRTASLVDRRAAGAETEKPAATALFGELSQQIDAFSGEILSSAIQP